MKTYNVTITRLDELNRGTNENYTILAKDHNHAIKRALEESEQQPADGVKVDTIHINVTKGVEVLETTAAEKKSAEPEPQPEQPQY